jgi:hypothetical protein
MPENKITVECIDKLTVKTTIKEIPVEDGEPGEKERKMVTQVSLWTACSWRNWPITGLTSRSAARN